MNTPCRSIFSLSLAGMLAASCGLRASPVNGSLWTTGDSLEKSMFADKVAARIGDILTIEVEETSSLVSSMKLSTSKASNVKNDFSKLLFSNILTHNGETPATDLTTAENSHEGTGEIDNSHTVKTSISVQVVDVLPNGNLVLEGMRVLTYAGETYYLLVQGICRPEDVDTENTISSSQVADGHIEVVAQGSLTEAEREGWASKLVNKYAP